MPRVLLSQRDSLHLNPFDDETGSLIRPKSIWEQAIVKPTLVSPKRQRGNFEFGVRNFSVQALSNSEFPIPNSALPRPSLALLAHEESTFRTPLLIMGCVFWLGRTRIPIKKPDLIEYRVERFMQRILFVTTRRTLNLDRSDPKDSPTLLSTSQLRCLPKGRWVLEC